MQSCGFECDIYCGLAKIVRQLELGMTMAIKIFVKYAAAYLILALSGAACSAHAQHEEMQHEVMRHEHDPSHGRPDFADESRLNVAVFLYEGALLLDYGVSAEMFLAADFTQAFNVYTVSETGAANVSILGDTATDFTFDNAPDADVVIVPGGPLWPKAGQDDEIVAYLTAQHEKGATLFSICTGSLLLAQAGFLENRQATTNIQAFHMMEAISPTTQLVKTGFVDGGDIVTSAGAGNAINATLALIERLSTPEIVADLRDRYLDYNLSGN